MSLMGDSLASHYGGSQTASATKSTTTTPPAKTGAPSAMATALSNYYKNKPAPTAPAPAPTPQPGPVKSFFQGVGNDIGAAGKGIGNFFKSLGGSSQPQGMAFPVGAGLRQTGIGPGTATNAKAQVIKEEQLGSQPVPKTPYNMNGSDVSSMARQIPRTVASLAMGNSGQTIEPTTMDPISRFLLGDESIKSLPTQASETEQNLNQAGVKGKAATGLAVTGVAANAVLNLLPFLAPFEKGAQGLADNLATNSEKVTLSPEQLQELATRPLADAQGNELVGAQKAVGERVQQMAKFYAEKGQSVTLDARAPAESVPGKIATAIGGKNQAPFLSIEEGGTPVEGAGGRVTPFSQEALPAQTESQVAPFAHEDLIPTPREAPAPFAHEQGPIPVGSFQAIHNLGNSHTELMNVAQDAEKAATYTDNNGATRVDRVKAKQLEKQYLADSLENNKQASVDFYHSLNPEFKVGDTVSYQRYSKAGSAIVHTQQADGSFIEKPSNESIGTAQKVKITGAEFDTSSSLDQQQKTGFPASFKLENLVGKDLSTGEEVRIYKNDLVNGKHLVDTIEKKPEEILKQYLDFQKGNFNMGYMSSGGSTPLQLNAEIIPGLSKTIQEDIIPGVKGVSQRMADIYHEIANTVNPIRSAPAEALDIIMKNKGDFERQVFRTEQAQKAIQKAWDKVPEGEFKNHSEAIATRDSRNLEFMHKVETGQFVGPENKDLADSYRERLNNAYLAISKYKDIPQLENFFPHFWEKPDEVAKNFMAQMAAKRPFEGGKSFLHHRIFKTIQEGMAAGYKPVTTNPEELMQIYETSVRQFVMAQKIAADLKKVGMWKFVPSGGKLEFGYAFINDPIARAYFPPEMREGFDGSLTKTYQQAGQFSAPESVARLINNYLSVNWINKSAIGRSLMQAKNFLTALRFGLSAFHGTLTTVTSIVNELDVSIGYLAQGKITEAIKHGVSSPAAVIKYWKDGQKFFKGDPSALAIEEAVFHGGASLRSKQYFKNQVLEKFGQDVRSGKVPAALGRLPFAALEGSARIVYSQIPKVKIGAFKSLFGEELARYSKKGLLLPDDFKGAPPAGMKTSLTIAREVWSNIDARMGQLNYDNLFWNNIFKGVMQVMWQAVGWNVGDMDVLGGSMKDTFNFAKDALQGKRPDFTPRMRFLIALLGAVGTFGAIYQYAHTGKAPSSVLDLFAPKNGETDQNGDPVRVTIPSLLKDIISYEAHGVIQTLADKLSPELAEIVELLQNRDYYGNYIYNPHDGVPKEIQQMIKFLAVGNQPFSVQSLEAESKNKSSTEQKAENFFGINKAASSLIESQKTKDIFNALSASGPKTPEEQQTSQLKNQYRQQIQQGNIPSLQELIKNGIVTDARGYRAFIKAAKESPVQRAYKALPKSVKSTLQKP